MTDRHGAPVGGAEVGPFCVDLLQILSLRREMAVKEVFTTPDGRFRIEDLPPGIPCSLHVHSAGYAPVELPDVKAPTAEPLRIELATARVLTGRVVGPLGEPVPRAVINRIETRTLSIAGGGSSTSGSSGTVGHADEEGQFRIDELAPGPLDLRVSAAGYRPRTLPGIEAPEEGGAPLEVVLERGESLEGRVVDGRGKPVPDASVYLRREEPAGPERLEVGQRGLTDADGRYGLAGLAPGKYAVTAQSPELGDLTAAVEVRPGANRLDLAFPGGVEVDGRVVDGAGGVEGLGAPVPGAAVSLLSTTTGRTFQTTTSADGTFRLPAVPDGDYLLSGEAEGFADAVQPGEVHISGQPAHGLELRLDRGAVLTGQLHGFTPESLASVAVQAFHYSSSGRVAMKRGALAGEDGYRISSLFPGKWEVSATVPDGRSARASVVIEPRTDRESLDLVVSPGITLTGRVLLDGAPLANASIMVQGDLRPENPENLGQTGTDWEGRFRISGLLPGHHRLVLAGPGGVGHGSDLEITGDREITLEIVTGSVTGRILSTAGTPVAGALVTALGDDPSLGTGFQGPAARSDENGEIELPHLAAGSYRITVRKEGFTPAESRVVVTPGGTVQMQIVLKERSGS